MERLVTHEMLPKQTPAELSRHEFLVDLKIKLMRDVGSKNSQIYSERIEPKFIEEHGRPPKDRHEVAEFMLQDPFFQMWSALSRIQQELYIDSTAECVIRQLPRLIESYRHLSDHPRHGSLHLDPEVEMPHYFSDVDIHCVPGGYLSEIVDSDDVYAGARYDIGTFLFGRGLRGPLNDLRGQAACRFLKETYPDLRPLRILDLGCATANNTLPYVDNFPDAKIFGIDVSAPCLRYGHARAEALGKSVNLSQQNAEHTDFESESFDLVVSHILFHETSKQAVHKIMKESYRLLKPGGVTLHVDVGRHISAKTSYDQFIADWDTMNNNEPFWGTLLFDMDMMAPALEAGFEADHVHEDLVDAGMGGTQYWVYRAEKA